MISKLKSLKNNQGFMKYFKNTSWLFAEKILRMIVGLFIGIWVARYLGPEQFGLFSYAQSFVGLFILIASLGIDEIVIAKLIKNQKLSMTLIATSFYLKLIGAIILFIILFIAIQFTSNNLETNMMIFIIATGVVFQSFNVISLYFQSKVMSKFIAYSAMISVLFSSILKIILILNNASLIAFVYMVVFDDIILAIGLVYFFITEIKVKVASLQFNKKVALYLIKNSWTVVLADIAISLYMKVDQVMIGNMMDSSSVAFYSVVVRFSDIWIFITVAITSSLFPAILNAKYTSYQLYMSRIENLYRLLVAIAIIISIIIFSFSNQIVLYTFGEEYEKSIYLLQLYIWSIIFVFLNNGSWKWYIAENLQYLATIRLLIGAIINIILNYYWIEEYGLIGAVYATLISYSIATYFGNLIFRKTRVNFRLQTGAIFSFYKITKGLT